MKKIYYRGKLQTVREWSKELGIPISTIHWRMKNNLSTENVLDISYKNTYSDLIKKVYRFIENYKEENNGLSPSIREIAEGCSIAIGSVPGILHKLDKVGLIRYDSSIRGISIPGSSWHKPKVDRVDEKLKDMEKQI